MASYWQNMQKAFSNGGKFWINNQLKPQHKAKPIHLSAKQDYPQAAALPLPPNIDINESTRFSPNRARDITSTAISTNIWNNRMIDITVDSSQYGPNADPHVDSYDCTGAVSLNSSMQSNVPSPFGGMHKFTHLNMPGGQWEQSSKWMSHGLHSSHYTNLRQEARKNWSNDGNGSIPKPANKKGISASLNWSSLHGNNAYPTTAWTQMIRHYYTNAPLGAISHQHIYARLMNAMPISNTHRMYCDKKVQNSKESIAEPAEANINKPSAAKPDTENAVALTPREKLKKAIKDYGSTVIVFHIAISLVSLGFFYQLVSSGLDVVAILDYIGLSSSGSAISNNVATGASTFVVAYAVHKVFAPFRISITLVSVPFLVRYLRKRGILAVKTSKKSS